MNRWHSILLVAVVAGCGASLENQAVMVANGGREVLVTSNTILHENCTTVYQRAKAADVPRIDAKCLPMRRAYAGIRLSWLALVAVIQAHRMGQASDEELLQRGIDLTKTLQQVPRTAAGLEAR